MGPGHKSNGANANNKTNDYVEPSLVQRPSPVLVGMTHRPQNKHLRLRVAGRGIWKRDDLYLSRLEAMPYHTQPRHL